MWVTSVRVSKALDSLCAEVKIRSRTEVEADVLMCAWVVPQGLLISDIAENSCKVPTANELATAQDLDSVTEISSMEEVSGPVGQPWKTPKPVGPGTDMLASDLDVYRHKASCFVAAEATVSGTGAGQKNRA
jgi:hypothetical protein